MMLLSLGEIREEIKSWAELIAAPERYFPTFGVSEDGARPHIEVDGHHYSYVVAERGQELSRFRTTELDELLCKVFADITFNMATDYEVHHRVPGQDFRRLLFKHQLALLRSLSPEWELRRLDQINAVLEQHPYNDG